MASFNNPVDARMWGDERFRSLTQAQPNAQTLWMYILTGPHNRGLPGLYNVGAGEMSEVLGWQPGDICGTAHELTTGDNPMLVADWRARVLLVPKVFAYRAPASSTNLSAWVRPFDAIPESPLKALWLARLAAHCWGRNLAMYEAFRASFAAQVAVVEADTGNTIGAAYGVDGGDNSAPESPPGVGGPLDVDSNNANPNATARGTSPASVPPEALAAVDLLAMLMAENDPKAKIPAPGSALYGKWVADVDRLHRIDGRGWTEIEAVVRWCQGDSFWKANILSASKLREKFSTLVMQMGRRTGVTGRNAAEFQRAMGRSRRP